VDRGDGYAVPADNPFVGEPGARGEIWAVGLRNPWRFAFDSTAAVLYVADVGQNAWEEINVADLSAAGLNYGWSIMEGAHCYGLPLCSRDGLVEPIVEYGHRDGACSVIGGEVYRGTALPDLVGHYFYSDWCEGWLRSFRLLDGAVTDHREWDVEGLDGVVSFGADSAGELYVLSQNGTVYRIVTGA
jgi:glucose/arabinose dehydrogenase